MEITTRLLKNAGLVKLQGLLNDATALQVDQAIGSLLALGVYKIIVDLGGLEELYSAGFLSLVMGQRACQDQGGELLLVNVPEHLLYVLRVTGLASYIRIADPASLPELAE